MNEPVSVEELDVEGVRTMVLTLDRAEALNPIDEPTIAELRRILVGYGDDPAVRAVVLTGAGDSFSAGGDLKKYQVMYQDAERQARFVRDFNEVCNLLERSGFVTVAMVNGTCLAGGMELALSCDAITIAAEARIGDGHLRFAQCPGGGAQRLVRAIGLQRARHWLLSGELWPAAVAVDAGLAVGAVPRAELRAYTFELVARLTRSSPLMVRNIKDLLVTAGNSSLDEGLEIEADLAVTYATTSHDAMEGLRAFAEKRPPHYRGA